MPRWLSPSSRSLRRRMLRSAGLVSSPNGDLTRDWLNSVVHSSSHHGTPRRTICWRQWLFILVNLKKQRTWHDRRLNAIHWLIKPGKAWHGSFLSRENSIRPKLQRRKPWNCRQRLPDAADGRYLWRSGEAMAKAPYVKRSLNLMSATVVLNWHSRTMRTGTGPR